MTKASFPHSFLRNGALKGWQRALIQYFWVNQWGMTSNLQEPRPVEIQDVEVETLIEVEDPYSLVVWNDEVNTFEWVIETLMAVCHHSVEQAEQCAMIIHTQGKYAVKQGSYEELKPMCDAITERSIGATIEILSRS